MLPKSTAKTTLGRDELISLILKNCITSSKQESLRFGKYVSPWHPVILEVEEKTGILLCPKDISGKTVGFVADTVLERLKKPR